MVDPERSRRADVVIRDATLDDAAAIAPLMEDFGYPADARTVADRLHALYSSDPSGRVLIALDGGRVLGFATLHSTPVLHRPTAVGRITALAVHPSAQGRGIGRELLRAADAHFRAQGLARIEVTSGPTHEKAYPFYRRLGYADHGVRFAKDL